MPKIAQKINEFKRVSAREVSQRGMAVLAMTIFSSSRKCLKSCQTINFEEKNFRIFFFSSQFYFIKLTPLEEMQNSKNYVALTTHTVSSI